MTDLEVDETQASRLESKWTDEETAHELLELLVDAGVQRDVLKVTEKRLVVDTS